jgi:hypothetical protein
VDGLDWVPGANALKAWFQGPFGGGETERKGWARREEGRGWKLARVDGLDWVPGANALKAWFQGPFGGGETEGKGWARREEGRG